MNDKQRTAALLVIAGITITGGVLLTTSAYRDLKRAKKRGEERIATIVTEYEETMQMFFDDRFIEIVIDQKLD